MPCADLAGVLGVVVEILGAQDSILIPDKPVRPDQRGLELHLDLHVFGNRDQCAAHFLD